MYDHRELGDGMGETRSGRETVRVGIIEKSPIILRALTALLSDDRRFEVAISVCDNTKFFSADDSEIDVLVSGWVGTDGGGGGLLDALRDRHDSPKVFIYSAASIEAIAHEAMSKGARAVVCKSTCPDKLLESIWAVALGRKLFPSTAESEQIRLTRREAQVLDAVANGLTARQIAGRLNLSHCTIKFHVKNAYEKMNVNSRTQAVAVFKRRLSNQSSLY